MNIIWTIKNYIRLVKECYLILKLAKQGISDPTIQELLKFRHFIFVGQKMKDYPSITLCRHFVGFEKFPSLEDVLHIRQEVLDDPDVFEKIYFDNKSQVSHHDLVIMGLGETDSDTFSRGMFGPALIKLGLGDIVNDATTNA